MSIKPIVYVSLIAVVHRHRGFTVHGYKIDATVIPLHSIYNGTSVSILNKCPL